LNKETSENIERYMKLVKELDPKLYAIKIALLETRVNPDVIMKFIRVVANMYYGTGYGKVVVQMNDGVAKVISSEEKDLLDIPAVLQDNTK